MSQTIPAPSTPASTAFTHTDAPILKLSVATYHRLIDDGTLTEADPVELIEGVLVYRMSQKPPHALCVDLVQEQLARVLPHGWAYRPEKPITLSDSEPEPDGAVVAGKLRDYAEGHPTPSQVALVIEVSDSTLAFDRREKQRIYARAGIAIYWIVNLAARTIEVYTGPQNAVAEPSYGQRQDYGETDAVPVTIVGVTVGTIAVGEVLP